MVPSGAPAAMSCDLSDACDELGIAAVRTGSIKPLWPECPPLFGYVRSVRLEFDPGSDSPLPELLTFLAASRGKIVFIDLGGRIDVQCWGTVLATAARHYGVLGAVVNGAARDVDGLRLLGLPCYACGVYPAAMRGRLRIASIDQPIELEGQTIAAGAFAVVDSSGAIFLPEVRVEEANEVAVRRARRESKKLQAIEAGADPRSIFNTERVEES